MVWQICRTVSRLAGDHEGDRLRRGAHEAQPHQDAGDGLLLRCRLTILDKARLVYRHKDERLAAAADALDSVAASR